jgi:molybdopterin adenylyltransferase
VTHAAWVLTVSDGVASGHRADRSGEVLADRLVAAGFHPVGRRVVPDGAETVAAELRRICQGFSGLVVTTGGTGFAPRDETPEGTRRVIDREAPGLAERARSVSPLGALSRGVAGTAGRALVLNLPGSPTGALESLDAVLGLLPHALDLLADVPTAHPAPEDGPASSAPGWPGR